MPLSVPKFLTKAFAAAGGKADVPMTGADINNGRADYDNGFPPVTRTPIAAGGIPPYGTDMNGVLFDLSSAVQYIQSGMVFPYSQDLADAIGGYDVGSVVTFSDIRYVSTISGNSVPPPSAGWQALSFSDPTETVRGMPLKASNAEVAAGIDASKMVTSASLRSAYELPIGQGQTWQNVASSRALNTNYTNTTGRTIEIAAYGGLGFGCTINVGGVNVSAFAVSTSAGISGDFLHSAFAIIPAGAVYRINAVGSLSKPASILELRA